MNFTLIWKKSDKNKKKRKIVEYILCRVQRNTDVYHNKPSWCRFIRDVHPDDIEQVSK